ncbi:hypothetical protein QQS21_004774 [Conoideocrella luteorostrata]|uniref:Carrier domain-containing protein n=1 Tax=Conoideocrella luteorostrata TaxID=1105319 RepID=A0AAJ0CRS0_9HYPO|nr:hypothetical protein QQS21_004774 [Conoideocrella luteorostrata]
MDLPNETTPINAADLHDIWNWNAVVPDAADKCVHELFAKIVLEHPQREAVCAWDGSLTYKDLDNLSTCLAYYLNDLGVGPGTIVPLCFEKSKWAPVAVLGVMKAGGASVALDVTQPEERLKDIVGQVGCIVIVSSVANKELSSCIAPGSAVVLLPTPWVSPSLEKSNKSLPIVAPSSMLYVVFTSGSTGAPKGVIITHSNFSSAVIHQQKALGFTLSSRVYDYVSYAFDVSWSNILHTLTVGACLCIPSQDQRQNNIVESIRDLRANYVDMTPSIFRLIEPYQVPGLQHISFSGEVVLADDVIRWKQTKRIINTYGPAECTVKSTVASLVCERTSIPDIGHAVGVNTWVVDPETANLAPIGSVGELWLEGPVVGQGYLNEPERTAVSFVKDPSWLLRGAPGQPGRHGRLYRTGDLVKYNVNGSLSFIGRNDNQVKIRGQRVELGEVEHHVRECLSRKVNEVGETRFSVVAELITPKESESPVLVVFFSFTHGSLLADNLKQKTLSSLIRGLNEELQTRVPVFMVPAVYIPVNPMPMTATGKTDRRQLRNFAESMTSNELTSLNPARHKRRIPETKREHELQLLWSDVLKINPDMISIDDSFLQIGGDSIAAMRLAAAAHQRGFAIKATEILKQPILSNLAPFLTESTDVGDVEPFTLLKTTVDRKIVQHRAADLCNVDPAQIEDVLPCTPLQEGLLALTERRPGDYISRNVIVLNEGIDMDHFRAAVEQVSASVPILRTRIVDLPGQGLVQVVVKAPVKWLQGNNIEAVIEHDREEFMGLGTGLAHFGTADSSQNPCDNKPRFIWTLHHAIYDGWSLPLLLEQVEKAYQGGRIELAPFQPFVKFVSNLEEKSAMEFWRSQLEDCESALFPPMPSAHYRPHADQTVHHRVARLEWPRSDITASTILRAAWVVVASRYTDTPDIIFEATLSGRQAPVVGVERMAGPTITTVPIRIRTHWDQTLNDFLQQVQSQAIEMTAFEQIGLQKIRLACGSGNQAPQPQMLLVIQPVKESVLSAQRVFKIGEDESHSLGGLGNSHTYALVLICHLEEDGVKLEANFDSSVVDRTQMTKILEQLERVLRQMCDPALSHAGTRMDELDLLSPDDLRSLWAWNATVPAVVDRCVHDMIRETSQRQPFAPAICSWDGELTYSELDTLSARLAVQLVAFGVKEGTIVLLCFEKSMWAPVAMLSVMKAGGVSVALDVTQPEQRLRMIADTVGDCVVLSSMAEKPLAEKLSPSVMAIETTSVNTEYEISTVSLPIVSAADIVYIVFTSGSTGKPKGVVITHQNFSSALGHQTERLGFNPSSRVLDFASYAFDAAWYNLLHTLYAGGCICIPSQNERQNDLSGSVVRLGTTFANLTPTVAGLLNTSALSILKLVELVGEAASPDLVTRIKATSNVRFAYGPAECSIMSTVSQENPDSIVIGRGIGVCTWVTDLHSTSRLAGIGCVGELWIEGPLVGQGYLNDAMKTATSFVENPQWLLRGDGAKQLGRRGRLYKTGDLVKYNTDGSLVFVGRKDMQVKIRGQRVELGDVEHHVREFLKDKANVSVAAEVINPRDSNSPMLVVFLGGDADLGDLLRGLEEQLTRQLPGYMVPAAYIAIEQIPTGAAGKIDRQQLRKRGGAFTRDELAALNPARRMKRLPETEMELTLQNLWADVLKLNPKSIGIDDSFLQIGGDSIAAMRLVAAAREHGMVITVADIFNQPQLQNLALLVAQLGAEENEYGSPFSLLNKVVDRYDARNMAAALCGDINSTEVEDIFPCTPIQEGLMALSIKRVGDYVNQSIFVLREDIDLNRLRATFDRAVESLPILRTRIVDLPGQGLVQVVVKKRPMKWLVDENIDTLIELDQEEPMGLGSELAHFGIANTSTYEGQPCLFWSLHHAIYDGWCFALMLHQIESIYKGEVIKSVSSFQPFVKHTMELKNEQIQQYWNSQFQNCERVDFPTVPSQHQSRADQTVTHRITSLEWLKTDITASTTVRTSWAILMARYTNAPDVVFGATVSGRQAPLPGIDRIAGPTIATVPVRVKVRDRSLSDLLKQIQYQATNMTTFEQTGLQRIRLLCPDIAQSTQFQSLLVIQPASQPTEGQSASALFEDTGETARHNSGLGSFHTYALALICNIEADGLRLHASFDSSVITMDEVEKLIEQLEHTIRLICDPKNEDINIADLELISPQDLLDLWRWNAIVPPATDRCVHDVIMETARTRPGAPAICAWDGELTYSELDDLSTRLAHDLIGIRTGTILPICFEKSMWANVAMLAVMKAGGAFVSLDPASPASRRQHILSQVEAQIILTSKQNAHLFDERACRLVIVDRSASVSSSCGILGRGAIGNDAAYVIFTSGSTGRPKGVLLEHQAVTTSCIAHANAFGICAKSRVLQFSSYTFDASIVEILTALMSGACICVPSDTSRLSGLTSVFNDLQVNWTLLTPTVARLLDPTQLPTLQTLVLGAEAVYERDINQWKKSVNLFNAYGPTECAVCCVINDYASNEADASTIGRPIGSVIWVVDPENHEKLVPIGAVGEIMVEGPILARGYLNDEEKTAAAFIQDPPWLQRGGPAHPGRRTRLYKTGDLAKYKSDGSLVFVGRKDMQVKVRGQRVELSEVEHHVLEHLGADVTVVAEMITPPNTDTALLIAFIVPAEASKMSKKALEMTVNKLTSGINDHLSTVVPSYMIPAGYFPLASVPMTATGKTDRRYLREMGTKNISQILVQEIDFVDPSNQTEKTLRAVWSEVLNISPSSISVAARFVKLGGDSITAMQVVSRCKKHGLNLTVTDLLRRETIREISVRHEEVSRAVGKPLNILSEEPNKLYPLSPVQRMFFAVNPNGLDHFNQSFILSLRQSVQSEALLTAAKAVVNRHSMLRARFHPTEGGGWMQLIMPESDDNFAYAWHDAPTQQDIQAAAKSRQTTLSIRHGPVFAVDVFALPDDRQVLLLTAHHLVVDLVSWRIIWHDLQEHLRGKQLGPRTTSFISWNQLLRSKCWPIPEEYTTPSTMRPTNFEFWSLKAHENTVEQQAAIHVKIQSATTRLLLSQSNDAFKSEPLDIIAAAMLFAFQETFPERSLPLLFHESHGREFSDEAGLDLSETVGWFTRLHPIEIRGKYRYGMIDLVRAVKDIRSENTAKDVTHDRDFSGGANLELLLNYVGAYHQFENPSSLFTRFESQLEDIDIPYASPKMKRFGLIEVNAVVEAAELRIAIYYGKRMKHQERLERWATLLASSIDSSCDILSRSPPTPTLADFPILNISYTGLDALFNNQIAELGIKFLDVKDIYPCTPLQEGIIISQKRGTASYKNYWIWKASSRDGIEPMALARAWKTVAKRHSIFSTVFIEHPETGAMLQLVLANSEPRIECISIDAVDPEKTLQDNPEPVFAPGQPQWAVTLAISNAGQVACRLDISHTLCDATSMHVLLRDLCKTYGNVQLLPAPQFRKVVEHLEKTTRTERLEYWANFLRGAQPCLFPLIFHNDKDSDVYGEHDSITVVSPKISSRIFEFCREKGITRSAFVQVSWALVLSQLTKMNAVCFGYLASSRNMEIDDSDQVVGPMISMLVGLIDLKGNLDEVLQTTQQNVVNQLAHQHVSLAEIHHELNLHKDPLFNTTVSVRDSWNDTRDSEMQRQGGLKLEDKGGVDPHEASHKTTLFQSSHKKCVLQKGPRTEFSIIFRNRSISKYVAAEVGWLLEDSVSFILQKSEVKPTGHQGLQDGVSLRLEFFRWRVGLDEDVVSTFWNQQLEGTAALPSPSSKTSSSTTSAHQIVEHTIKDIEESSNSSAFPAVIWASWAIWQARYLDSSEAIFAAQIDGSYEDSQSLQQERNFTETYVPLRVIIDPRTTVSQFTRMVEEQHIKIAQHARAGMLWISQLSEDTQKACGFQAVVAIRRQAEEVKITPNAAITCEEQVMELGSLQNTMHQFEHILRQMCDAKNATAQIASIDLLSQEDLKRIWTWNSFVPPSIDRCVHDLVTLMAQKQPNAVAIDAWDGKFTYGEVDELSTRLGCRLNKLGVYGTIVPLCFEKSMWTSIAMLGVMKAGGASVSLDVNQPVERLQAVVSQVHPMLIVCSEESACLATSLYCCKHYIVLNRENLVDHTVSDPTPLPYVDPKSTLFLTFTSGSTGEPKGVIITHSNLASAIEHQKPLGFVPTSRVYDFASYAFDVAWYNSFQTLANGGCLCVPSEYQRKNELSLSILKFRANTITLTPTVVDMVDDSVLGALWLVETGGETVTQAHIDRIQQYTKARIAYGPAECTIGVTWAWENPSNRDIGRGLGACTWVVDAESRLAALGCIGELWIEGPLVGGGYYNDAEKEATSFFEDPPWLLRGGSGSSQPGRRGRLYKTGDLVKYKADGSLVFVGRKDTQVKIRGQRVELGEVEHHVRECVRETKSSGADDILVVAEVFTPKNAETAVLSVFLATTTKPEKERRSIAARLITDIMDRLMERVLVYMIPTAYITIDQMPLTMSGKTNRKVLRQMGEGMTLEQLACLNPIRSERRRPPTNEHERRLRNLWATVLKTDPEKIGIDDSFLQIGGDSITAMRLVAAGRDQGLPMSVADIFTHLKLSRLAEIIMLRTFEKIEDIDNFALLKSTMDKKDAQKTAAALCDVDPTQVEDIFPCTPLQEGLLALTEKRAGDYVSQNLLPLRGNTDVDRLQMAIDKVAASTPILRTRIVDLPGQGLVQVVVKESTNWRLGDHNESTGHDKDEIKMGLGSRLAAFRLVGGLHSASSSRHLLWTLHHAVYDGWSLPILLDRIEKAYNGQEMKDIVPFQRFVKYTLNLDEEKIRQYWASQFEEWQAVNFPSVPTSQYQPCADHSVHHEIKHINWPHTDVSPSTRIRAAWAVLAAQYTNSSDIAFGATVSGRQAPIPGIEGIVGPTIATVPIRVRVDWNRTVDEYMQQLQNQAIEMIAFEQSGLQRIRVACREATEATQFQTLLDIQHAGQTEQHWTSVFNITEDNSSRIDQSAFNTFALALICVLGSDSVTLRASFDACIISEAQAMKLTGQFEHVLRTICDPSNTNTKLSTLNWLGSQDVSEIWKWNAKVPHEASQCVHDIVTHTARRQPTAPAICAWDGDMMYSDVDELSTMFAHQLVRHGVRHGVVVPLCFEKSMWSAVAMLGVMKAGGASVALDVTQPEERLRAIIKQVQPIVVAVSSKQNAPLMASIGSCEHIVTVDPMSLRNETIKARDVLPQVDPKSPLYISFTSGSTGEPKGVIITHSNFTSAVEHQQQALGFTPTSRVYDFASYAFDVAWYNAFQTLAAGGCLCVPSESQRKNELSSSIVHLRANSVTLTPTVLDAIDDSVLPSLRTVEIGGEAVNKTHINRIQKFTTARIAYGPVECTIGVTWAWGEAGNQSNLSDRSIGRGLGACTWVVDPASPDVLVGVGCIGELYIEGPLVGEGYLNDPNKTAKSFIDDPLWLVRGAPGHPGRRGRLYKTGDLVRYLPDGSLVFVGRKDSQVKIRGQRVELGEVEHHVRSCFTDRSQGVDVSVVAEVITPSDYDASLLLVFISPMGGKSMAQESLTSMVAALTSNVNNILSATVPTYMIPTGYIPLPSLPRTTTGKTDRRLLRAQFSARTIQELRDILVTRSAKRHPVTTPAESQLQRIWSMVLNMEAGDINADDSFFQLGGDSIQAMRVVALTRAQGSSLTVIDIFRQRTLRDIAALIKNTEKLNETIPPLSLLSPAISASTARRTAAALCNVDEAQIQDIFPCTPLQEGLLAMTTRRPGDYVATIERELEPSIDSVRFKSAWNNLVGKTPILRTRIIDLPEQGLVQVVLDQQVSSLTYEVDEQDSQWDQHKIGLGTSLNHVALRTNGQQGTEIFTWSIHHALYDGWSMPLLLCALEGEYFGNKTFQLTTSQPFVKYVMDSSGESAVEFWKQEFAGLQTEQYPALPSAGYQPRADSTIHQKIGPVSRPSAGYTMSTIVRTAWALVTGSVQTSPDVVFGAVVTGRQAPLPELERMAGPTVATVPVRININRQQSLRQIYEAVEDYGVRASQYEQMGLQYIQRVSTEAQEACRFQTLVVVQPATASDPANEAQRLFVPSQEQNDNWKALDTFSTYAITIVCEYAGSELQFSMSFDSGIIDPAKAQRILEQLTHTTRQICDPANIDTRLGDLDVLTSRDLEDIWSWNATVPLAVDDHCVHDLVTKQAQKQPSATAICTWDGKLTNRLTYAEVDDLSTRLACYLVTLGIGPGIIVPLCFEKSMWTSVAMLGVMKTGATSVALDVTQPKDRLRAIVGQVQLTATVSSREGAALVASLCSCKQNIIVDLESLQQMVPTAHLPDVDPKNTLYLAFTSGSTGEPKGVKISHSNLASAIKYQQQPLGFTPDSRVYDFASYAFDVAWYNAFQTLAAGGCLCVPSEHQRKNELSASIVGLNATSVTLTPTVLDVLDDDVLKTLDILETGGEAVHQAQIDRIKKHTNVRIAYGPVECTIGVTWASENLGHRDIGRGLGACTWVVDPDSPEKLVGVGCIGELWIEGPLVGDGYLNDPVKTAASFVDNPSWLVRGSSSHPGRCGRLYKTGDLVRYKSDGSSLVFIGRKDMQVKIRGQRVELSEVEYHVRKCLANEAGVTGKADASIVAEVVTPRDTDKAVLLALIMPAGAAIMTQEELTLAVAELTDGTNRRLSASVPSYMIPMGYLPLASVPRTTTGKTDRRSLKSDLDALSLNDLRDRLVSKSHKRSVATATEALLQRLWASVLGIEGSAINADDSFFELGGDSIQAMRLSTATCREGMPITVSDVLNHPQLSQLALCLCSTIESPIHQPAHFSHLDLDKRNHLQDGIIQRIMHSNVEAQDILPVSHSQRQFLDGSIKGTPIGINHFFLDLPASTSISRLAASCDDLIQHFEILRTIFVAFESKFYQVILKHLSVPLEIRHGAGNLSDCFESLRQEDGAQTATLGRTFLRLVLLQAQTGDMRLVIRISHAQYDGISFGNILSALSNLYEGHSLPQEPSLSSLIHVQNEDLNYSYWDSLLKDSSMTYMRSQDATVTTNESFSILRLERTTSSPNVAAGMTKATLFTSACALMLARMTGSHDVLFGRVVAGRGALPVALRNIVFPCITVLPVRVKLPPCASVSHSAPAQVRDQYITGLKYENIGLPQLSTHCESWPKDVQEFGCVAQYQNVDESPVLNLSGCSIPTQHYRAIMDEQGSSNTIQIVAVPSGSQLNLIITAKSTVCDMALLHLAMEELCAALASY